MTTNAPSTAPVLHGLSEPAKLELLHKISMHRLTMRPGADSYFQRFEGGPPTIAANAGFSAAAAAIADATTGELAAHLDRTVGANSFARLERAGELLKAAGVSTDNGPAY